MIVLVFLIIISAAFYFYYKTKQFRTHLPIRKKWYQSKAGATLGAFLLLFGVNQLFLFQSAMTYVISGIFIVLGGMMAWNHYKAARHYRSFIDEEARLNP